MVPASTPTALPDVPRLLMSTLEQTWRFINDATEPEVFRPERFLERKPTVYERSPFGSGTRQCIGRYLALAELKITMATILSRVELVAVDTNRSRQRFGTFFVPRSGLRVRVQPRLRAV